jgi:hypothetical protein
MPAFDHRVHQIPGVSGAVAWFRVVSRWVLVRVLLVGFWWRDVRGTRRINVRF